MGRRSDRRKKKLANPPVVLENPPPTLIPEEVHTSPHRAGNPNSGEKLRNAPAGVSMKEKTVQKLGEAYKSKNPIARFKNEEVIDAWNQALDKRCLSLLLQEQPQTRNIGKAIAKFNNEARTLVVKAQALSDEVEAMGEKAVKLPAFLLTDPVLPK